MVLIMRRKKKHKYIHLFDKDHLLKNKDSKFEYLTPDS